MSENEDQEKEPSSRSVATGGGTYINGSVNMKDGDFINRDQINVFVENLFVGTPKQPLEHSLEELQKAGRDYLTFLFNHHCLLNLKGIDPYSHGPVHLKLLDIYVPLWAYVPLRTARASASGGRDAHPPVKTQLVLNLLRDHAGVVLLGNPGAGKSAFLKWLVLKIASNRGKDELHLGNRLPVLLPLTAYASEIVNGKEIPLERFIGEYFDKTVGNLPIGELLQVALAGGQALVLLDGLDEIKDMGLRSTVAERVTAFYDMHRSVGNKFVLTSRLTGYGEARPVAEDLIEARLLDFNSDQIRDFINQWTLAVIKQFPSEGHILAVQEAERERDELLSAIWQNEGVRQLAGNPLLLTILAVMEQRGVSLPNSRVKLYDHYIQIMLADWNRVRSLSGRPAGQMQEDEQWTLRILTQVALWMHHKSPKEERVRQEELRHKLQEIFVRQDDPVPNPQKAANHFLGEISGCTGLLAEFDPGEYGFLHQTFVEYLAAVEIAHQAQGDPEKITGLLRPCAGDPNWHEVNLLVLEYVGLNQHLETIAGKVIETLSSNVDKPEEVILAGEASADLKNVLSRANLQICGGGLDIVMREGKSAQSRLQAGDLLARLDNLSEEVRSPDAMAFCFVPAGRFLMGDEGHRGPYQVDLGEYWIGRFPVTVAQFDVFARAGGYSQSAYWSEARGQSLWTEAGFKGMFDETPRTDRRTYGVRFDLKNHPVVGISWYEALAFARWLNKRANESSNLWLPQGWEIRLPSEAEWEKAARGGLLVPTQTVLRSLNKRLAAVSNTACEENFRPTTLYPWGNNFSCEQANTSESAFAASSAVGCFPGGLSRYGCEDLAGNVSEWTASVGCDLPYNPLERREDPNLSGNRVIRGGSWYHTQASARTGHRQMFYPASFYDYVGFRVVAAPASNR